MTEKTFTLASLNVKGLKKSTSKPREIKLWLASLPFLAQIVLIQEHHLGRDGIQATAKGIEFWQGASFWNEGIPMGRSKRMSVGTAILVDKSIAPLVTAHGTLSEGRAQYVTIQSPDNGTLSILNVYALHTSNERAQIWSKFNQSAPASDHYILGGDFNHLEVTENRDTAGLRRMHRRESAAWHHMTLKLGLTDAWRLNNFRKLSRKEFTFDNRRSGANSAISKIDKFMISQTLEERGGRIEAAAMVRKLSDHSPLVITIWGHPSAPNVPTRYFDLALLKEDKCKKEMLDAWNGLTPPDSQDWPAWLEVTATRVVECNSRLSKERK
jgi:exonuclease III